MSTQVDNRVVSMQFDNKRFESNVSDSMKTLDKLKQSLKLDGATKGLEEIDRAAKKTDLSSLSKSVDTIQSKFSALSVMAITALTNITNSAVNAGKRMVSALTIQPISTGFSEYETQINAIQTILANTESKGTTLQDVNNALAELNTYADKTIYNFTEMTRNIGTFTAAGVDLDTSVSAIKGIANLAAVSGSTSQQASTAMYQLSQALSSGTVKLMDWNSVVNAGMGGQVFQDALKETARVHKINIDAMIKEEGSFRETLQNGWLTSEILTETLSKFTGDLSEKQLKQMGYTDKQIAGIVKMGKTANDAATKVKTFSQLFDTLKEAAQSGWTKTWEIIVGDFGEAKDLLTEISDIFSGIIGESAGNRNALLSGALSTGWKQLLNEGITDAAGFEERVTEVAKKHGVDLSKMINDETTFQDTLKDGWMTSEILSESITEYGKKLKKMSAAQLEAAGYTMKDVKAFEELEKKLKNGEISLEEFTALMSRKSGRELLIESLRNALKGIVSVVKPVKAAFTEIFGVLKSNDLYGVIESIKEFSEKLTISEETADKIKRTFKGLFAILDIGVHIIQSVFGGLLGFVGPAGDGILGLTASIGDFLVKIRDMIKSSNIFVGLFRVIGNVLKTVTTAVMGFTQGILDMILSVTDAAEMRFKSLTNVGNGVKKAFVGLFNFVGKVAQTIGNALGDIISKITDAIQNAEYDKIYDLFNSGIISAIGIFFAKFIKSAGDFVDNAAGFIEKFKGLLDGLQNILNAFAENIKAKTLKEIAIAVGILAASLFVISLIDSKKLLASLGSIAGLFTELMIAMYAFSKIAEGKGIKSILKITLLSSVLKSLATALLILAVAMKIIGTMSWGEMARGLISIAAGLAMLVGAVRLLPEKDLKKTTKAIKKLSKAMIIFAVAMKILGSMSWEEMAIGLISMASGLSMMVGAVRLLPKDVSKKATNLKQLAMSMVILGAALKIMGSMTWKEMGIGLISMAAGLSMIIGTVRLLPKDTWVKTMGLFGLATAMVVLASALKIMGSMSWEEMGRSLISLGGGLGAFIGVLHAMPEDAFKKAGSIFVLSAAMVVLGSALRKMGSLSLVEIGKGLLAIAGTFVIFGVAARALSGVVGTILKLSGAIALFGVGIALIGAGVSLLSLGISGLIVALGAGGGVIVGFISSLISLIPYVIEQVGVGIIKLCKVIAGSADAICNAVTVIILAVIKALVTCIPALVDGLLTLITSVLQALVKYIPTIVSLLFDFLIAIINTAAEKIPDLIQAIMNLVMAILQGSIDALKNIDTKVLFEGIKSFGIITAIVAALAAVAGLIPLAIVGAVGVGLVIAELAIIISQIGALAQLPGLSWLVSEGGNLMEAVGTAIGQFVGGIVRGVATTVSAGLPQIGTDLSIFMKNIQPFLNGAKAIDPAMLKGVAALGGVILELTAANILDGLTSWFTGGTSLADFGSELAGFGRYMAKYAEAVAGIDPNTVVASATAAKALAELARKLPNSGGVAAWFAGENDIDVFGQQLVPFGKGLKEYSLAIAGIDTEAVVNSATAAQSLAELANNLPNSGGVAGWFAGNNDMDEFGIQLVTFGKGLKLYSEYIAGIDPEAVVASATAAQSLAELANNLPNSGGVAGWFAGNNNMDDFGIQLVTFGKGLKSYAESITGIDTAAVTNSAIAAKSLVELANNLPNSGGVVSWFVGNNDIGDFGVQLVAFGKGLKSYASSISGIDTSAVSNSAVAAKALVELANNLPNTGGVVSWFVGNNDMDDFGVQLIGFGKGLKSYAASIAGIDVTAVAASAIAGQALASLANSLPNTGGLVSLLAGDQSIANLGYQLIPFGLGMREFSKIITSDGGINVEAVTAVTNAGLMLSALTNSLPNSGGLISMFTGEQSLANLGTQLVPFGEGIKAFSDTITADNGINPEAITAAGEATKSLVAVYNILSSNESVFDKVLGMFSEDDDLASFGSQLSALGKGIKAYSDVISEGDGINPEAVTSSATALKTLAEMTDIVPKNSDKIVSFAENLGIFSDEIDTYFTNIADVSDESLTKTTNIANALTALADVSKNKGTNIKAFGKNIVDFAKKLKDFNKKLKNVSEKNISAAIDKITKLIDLAGDISGDKITALKNFTSALGKLATDGVNKFVNGLKNNTSKSDVKTALGDLLTNAVNAISTNDNKNKFKKAGKYLIEGLAEGIKANKPTVTKEAQKVADAVETIFRSVWKINSPSKVFYKIALGVGEGIQYAFGDSILSVKRSATDLANTATNGFSNTIQKIAEFVNSDMDTQPTIRPVLDLSDVQAGANSIAGLFAGNRTLAVSAPGIGAISASMSSRQNGNNNLASAINKLAKANSKSGNTYNINGVSYSESSDVADAIQTLVRAVTIEGRS